MVEESETPGEGGRMGESDFLAERRARRATETGEAALLRRAEAAEATVKTLESHVASLQARLQEAEEDRRRTAALLEAERAHGAERESELRRVKQREYAEQQLRVEAEDRVSGLERERRSEPAVAAPAGEHELATLSGRIDGLQRQLAEAEQAAGAERASLRRAEADLQSRVAELERRAEEIQRGLLAERSARERAERELAGIREGHRRMEGLLGEIRALVARLGALLGGSRSRPEPPPEQTPMQPGVGPVSPSAPQRGLEMADALAAAVERLRSRAQTAPPLPEDPGEGLAATAISSGPIPDPSAPLSPRAPLPPGQASGALAAEPALPAPDSSAATPAAPAQAQEPVEAAVPARASTPVPAKPGNKHSESLIGRIRNRRKQRRTP